MKKILITIIGLFSVAYGQLYQSMPQRGYGPVKNFWVDSVLIIPTNVTSGSNLSGGREVGKIRYNIIDSSVQVYTGSQWLAGNRSTGLPYWELATGGALTGNNNITGSHSLTFTDQTSFNVIKSGVARLGIGGTTTQLYGPSSGSAIFLSSSIASIAGNLYSDISGGASSGRTSSIRLTADETTINPSLGVLIFDSLAVGSSQTDIIGWTSTAGANRGKVQANPAGTGVFTALGINVGSAGAFVVNGGALGTPSSGILTNATGLPEGGLSTTDITTNNASTSKHGFLPKLTSNSIYYVNNSGTWTGLTVGAANTVLAGNGVTSAPSWLATSSLTGLPYWPLTGTGTLTGNTTIDGSGGPYNVTIKSNPGGLLRADGNVVTIGDPDVAQTGALMRIDAGAGTAYILSTAISGGSNGDAITLIDNTTGELGVAPNLAFNLQKQGTEIYASNGLIFAKDKAGNKTQISPHNKNGDWVYNSTNAKGSTTEINMTDAIKTIEQLTKRVYELEKKLNIKTTKPKKLIHKK